MITTQEHNAHNRETIKSYTKKELQAIAVDTVRDARAGGSNSSARLISWSLEIKGLKVCINIKCNLDGINFTLIHWLQK